VVRLELKMMGLAWLRYGCRVPRGSRRVLFEGAEAVVEAGLGFPREVFDPAFGVFLSG